MDSKVDMDDNVSNSTGVIRKILLYICEHPGKFISLVSFLGACVAWIFMTCVFMSIRYVPDIDFNSMVFLTIILSISAFIILLFIIVPIFAQPFVLYLSNNSNEYIYKTKDRWFLTAPFIVFAIIYPILYFFMKSLYGELRAYFVISILLSFSVAVIFLYSRIRNMRSYLVNIAACYIVMFVPFLIYCVVNEKNKSIIDSMSYFMIFISAYILLLIFFASKYIELMNNLNKAGIIIGRYISVAWVVFTLFLGNPGFLIDVTIDFLGVGFKQTYNILLNKQACDGVKLVTETQKSCEYDEAVGYGIMRDADIVWRMGAEVLLSYGLGIHSGFKTTDFCTPKKDIDSPQQQRLVRDACLRLRNSSGLEASCVLTEGENCSEPLWSWRRKDGADGLFDLVYVGPRLEIVIRKQDMVMPSRKVEPPKSK